MAAYDPTDQHGRPVARVLPKVPGMNASAMGMQRTIGHTPWRATAPKDPDTGQITGTPKPAPRYSPRPTGGRGLEQPGDLHRTRKGKTNNNRAARAARARARKRANG